MILLMKFTIIFLALTLLLCMFRAIKGPFAADRMISINIVGTKTIVIIACVSFILHETYFIDVAIVYALISFVASIVVSDLL